MGDRSDLPESYLASAVCTAMMRLGVRMAAVFDARFAPMGMTQAQFRTLLIIRDEGGEDGIAPSALAERLLIDRATVTALTARLEASGWLERRPGENRRTHRLVVTPHGRERLETILPDAVALADETLDDFGPDETRHLLAYLDRLEARVRAMDPKQLREGG